ncbi:S1 family peptidase [Stenotrophomonas indicatrix]|uniref:S1 family peptidase n=1 Tax=Stenotrophomonas indicatrix TaxID=2045451 RepID=UPI0028A70A66|nr:serine protease [Stenotrophomonas indicatrix]
MHSVLITDANPALATLRPSWSTAEYSDSDGIGPMASLYEAGDALVAVTRMDTEGPTVLGTGVMIGPGLLLTATHVLDEFPSNGAPPVFMTFLPDAARAWLPVDRSTSTGRSAYVEDRRLVSDVTIISCTLNSDAHAHHPLMLAPLRAALPLIGERLWAFGFRHGDIDQGAACVTPLVSSGQVTQVFPHGRGEHLPASCIEVAMETRGGMSGGPVVNAKGDLVGIVTSSIEGGPSYVTLIWDALRLKVRSTLPLLAHRGDINLFTARNLGLVRLNGMVTRNRRGDVTLKLSEAESRLMAMCIIDEPMPATGTTAGRALTTDQLDTLQTRWSDEMEEEAAHAGLHYLQQREVPAVRAFLAAAGIPTVCLDSILQAEVEDMQGLEYPEILSAREQGGIINATYAFELLTVVWTVEVAVAEYQANAAVFDAHFINVQTQGETMQMEVMQRCYFEADIEIETSETSLTSTTITLAGVIGSSRAA